MQRIDAARRRCAGRQTGHPQRPARAVVVIVRLGARRAAARGSHRQGRQHQHRRHEQVQVGEEPSESRIPVHVPDRVHVNQETHPADSEDHDRRERIEQERKGNVKCANGNPIETAIYSAALSGKADTVGAMACAVAGAWQTIDVFPLEHIDALDQANTQYHFEEIAEGLYELAHQNYLAAPPNDKDSLTALLDDLNTED